MKTKFLITALLAGLMPTLVTAQEQTLTEAENSANIPARISETVYAEAPDDHVLGSEDAVQTMIVYASVTCPHCGGWFTEEWPKVKTELVEAGTMRFVLRELRTGAGNAAEVGFTIAACAPSAQYFEMIEFQMENQAFIAKEVAEKRGDKVFYALAARAGMDNNEAVTACMTNPDIKAHMDENEVRATLAKIEGVPAFFINGDPYFGPQDAESLIALVKDMEEKGITAIPEELTIAPPRDHTGHNHD
ncbi:thioredoxin domain-containing protein [Litorimonas sp. WD9-15]|uniref:thioredoxin domain-containing protein n=1 Tax=Litorimonas sp. WD9-15 TaxID=3418716 RepID=UPI003CFEA580